MTRALVTGATGFIGWHLAERLRDEGWHVRALVRPGSHRPLPRGVERLTTPLSADAIVPYLAADDVVFHLAGLTRAPNRNAFLLANAATTREVARAARGASARLVYVSSQAAAGPGTRERPRQENDPPEPCSVYGESKLAGEAAVRETEGLRWTVLRPVAVYGPRDRDFLTLFRLASLGVFPVLGSRATPYMLVHVDDLVSLIVRAATCAASDRETLFLGHPDVHDAVSLARAMGHAVGRHCRLVKVPRTVLDLAARLGEIGAWLGRPGLLTRSRVTELTAGGFVCALDRAHRVLGVQAHVDIEAGFAATAAWYREQGLLRRLRRA